MLKCLQSLKKIEDEALMYIFVIDNASSDNSLKLAKNSFPEVDYIISNKNLGFSAGNNLALRKVKTEYVLILNPDTEVFPGTISYMLEFMEKCPAAGAASCRVEKVDGTLDWASHRGFPTPWASFLYFVLKDKSLYNLTGRDFTKPHEVDAVAGAFLLTRKSVLDKVGLFDEDYFMYAEDIDLCYRIKEAGFKIMYVPQVRIIHYKGVASGIKKHSREISTANVQSRKKTIDYFYSTMLIFYKKHLQQKYPFFVNWLVFIGINFKWQLAKRSLTV